MNWIDRTVGYVAPEAGLRRLRARAAFNAVGKALHQQLGYEGAKQGRGTSGWWTSGKSANAEIATSLGPLRDRVRALVRDDPQASKALNELVTKFIGTGIMPRSAAKNPKTRATIDELFAKWAPFCCGSDQPGGWGAAQSLFMRSVIESGEALIRHRDRRIEDGLPVPYQIQLLEGDFLDTTKTETKESGYSIQGVEFDKIGNRRSYWLFASHPGNVINTSPKGGYASASVPASEIIHGFFVDRIGQVRGVPRPSCVILAMRDLADYHEAERVRKKIEACFSAFVTQTGGFGGPQAGTSATTDTKGTRIEEFVPGMVSYLRPDEDIKFANPQSDGNFEAAVRVEQRRIAAGWNLPYELLTGDFSQVNYSAYRGGLIGFRDWIDTVQWNFIIPWWTGVWNRLVRAMWLAGLIEKEDTAVEWSTPAFDLLDRANEAEADLAMLRAGTMTLPQAIGRQGYDPDTQLEEIAATNKKLDDMGIVLDSDPRKTAASGQKQMQNKQDEGGSRNGQK